MKPSQLFNANVIEGFIRSFLWEGYDDASDFSEFHRDLWRYFCLPDRYVAIAAPRGHSKSTSVTIACTLASMLFRVRKYAMIISDTEGQAVMFLGQIKHQLQENKELGDMFDLKRKDNGEVEFEKDTETDIIVVFSDGTKFRIMAKGAEQKVRGRLWDGKRPDLIVVDDLENDEMVVNKERRIKLLRWFNGALLPSLSPNGIVRIVGTILHTDALLERLMPQETRKTTRIDGLKITSSIRCSGWTSVKFKAHNEDFSLILWPSRWSKEKLQHERDVLTSQGLGDLYVQEYLNQAIDETTAIFKIADLTPMRKGDDKKPKNFYITGDLAISQAERADFSVFCVGGLDADGILHVVDVIRGRFDADEMVEMILKLQQQYKPLAFGLESGQIQKAIGPFLRERMVRSGIYPNIVELKPHRQDKIARTSSIRARIRIHAVRFAVEADWFPDFQEELTRFPRAKHDDSVDALSYLGLLIDNFIDGLTEKEQLEDEQREEYERYTDEFVGRSSITGY